MRDSTQPPNMSPFALVSAGIAMTRIASPPRGVSPVDVVSAMPERAPFQSAGIVARRVVRGNDLEEASAVAYSAPDRSRA